MPCGCGEDRHRERNLYSLAARTEALYPRANLYYSLAGTADVVPAGPRFRFGPDFSEIGPGQLYSVSRARSNEHDHPLLVHFLRNRIIVGPSIWLPEGDACRTGSPNSNHGWKNPRG